MKVLIFGGTGMVGQDVPRACLRDPRIMLRRLMPGAVTITEELARSLIAAARGLRPPSGSPIVEGRDIGPLATLEQPD